MAITLLGALRHQLRNGAFAGAQVGDHHGRHELQQRLGDAFPGPPRNVLAAELAGQLVEVAAHLVLPLAQDQAQRLAVLRRFGHFGGGLAQQVHQLGGRLQAVEGVLPGAPVVHQPGLFQLRQVGGNLALALAQNLLQLRHGKLFLLQQQQEARAGWDRPPDAAISGLTP